MTTTPTSTGELVERAKYALTKGSMFVSGHYQLIADLLSALQKAEGERNEARGHVERLRDVAANLIGELSDPGTEALAAVWCANQFLASSLLGGGAEPTVGGEKP